MNARLFLATTAEGIVRAARSQEGEWSAETLLSGADVRCLAADPLDSDVIFAGTQANGVLRSTDRGSTWHDSGLQGHTVKAVAVSPLEPGIVYAGTKPALMYVSRDGGDHWSELTSFRKIPSRRVWFSPAEPPFTAYVQGIALSPTDPNILLVGIEFGAVVRSADGGETWTGHRKRALRDCHSIAFHATDGNWAYEAGGTGAGAAVSRDGGKTWEQTKTGLDRHYGWACAADAARPDVWYVSVSTGPSKAHSADNAQAHIFRAANGNGWTRLRGGLPEPIMHMPYALITDPATPGHVYAGLSNGHIWHSADYGDSWRRLPVDLGSIRQALIML